MTTAQPIVAGPFRIRETWYPPGLEQPPHVHGVMGVTLVVRGMIRELACRREELATSLSVVVKPAGVEHADEVGPEGAHTLQICFDPSAVRSWLGDDHGLDRWSWLHGRQISREMLALLRQVRRTRHGGGPAEIEDSVLDVLAAAREEPAVRGQPPTWLRRVREALDDRLDESVSVASLARHAGTHPISVSRAFRRHFACTITEYRRRERLRRAARLIEGSRQQLSAVAHAVGYADHAHLCRAFRVGTGLSPSQFRALVRAEEA